MKKSLLLMPLMAAAALTSCSNDEQLLSSDSFDERFDGQAYVRVRIAMPEEAGTRALSANDFTNGTQEEQAIKSIGLKFYNADGSFYGYGIPVENPAIEPTTTPEYNVEAKVKDAVIVLQINSNAPMPTHVVAYANCGDRWKLTPEPNIDNIDHIMSAADAEGITGYSIHSGDKEYFAMTSSNYLGDASGQAGFVQGYQTQVHPRNFKPTQTEAEADGAPVDIYVERLAAKVKVSPKENMKPETIQSDGGYTLDFVIDGYALGGTNTKSYYIKHIDSQWSATSLWPDWNDLDAHRCFWAADMNYYETNIEPDLDYVSYNEVKANLGGETGQWMYCSENTQTMFGSVEESKDKLTDVMSAPRYTAADVNRYLFQEFAYVIGHYEVKKNGVALDGDENPELFEYAGKILTYKSMLTHMASVIGNVVFARHDAVGDKPATYTSVNMVDKGWLKIGSYGDDASLVCLQLDENVTEDELQKYYIKNTNDSGKNDSDYTPIQSKDDVIKLLKQASVQAYGFKYDADKKGYLAYFPILIEHLNTGGRYGVDSRGYYGVVRNHCYNITIESIKGLGIGIYNPEVDIIPEDKIKPLYLAARFNILSWRVVSQSVEL